MTWLQRYRVRHYVTYSIWIPPVIGMLVALVVARFFFALDALLGWKSDLNPATVESLLGTLAASMFTFIVFISSALLVSIQLASAQLTPRIIRFVFRDPITKITLTWFVFSFTLSLAVLIRIHRSIPLLSVNIATYSCLVSLGVFFYLMNHVGKSLRPSGTLQMIVSQGRKVIESAYPLLLTGEHESTPEPILKMEEKPASMVTSIRSGVILTLDIANLVSLARQADCVIELVPRVGDYLAPGDPLFQIYGNGANLSAKALRQSVALGLERTLEHDPAYAFRIIVDIAAKALSPAINDPTTAVLALDQIHHLLHTIGNRRLDSGYIRDAAGQIRLIYPTPDWEDYVYLAVTEIRHWGGGSIQIVRRLRAMLENLIQLLPEERACLLRQELRLLQRTVERNFPDLEDRALANGIDRNRGNHEHQSSDQFTRHGDAA